MSDDRPEYMQAECIVAAIDNYLATMPWPLPTAGEHPSHVPNRVREHAREFLVRTLATSLRMSEPRKSDLQKV